jgi:hypothetical protein
MVHTAKKLGAGGFLLFLGLWIVGVSRPAVAPQVEHEELATGLFSSVEDQHSNRQVANNLKQIGLTLEALPHLLDQKDLDKVQVYEKTAHLSSSTTSFTEDEERLRGTVALHKATIANERSTGIGPNRTLTLGITVHPDRFEELLADLKQVGHLTAIHVEQQDRTGQLRQLHAQRQSLKKHQDAVLKLRQTGKLSVEEALKVEQKLLEVEKEIHALGVQLGDLLGMEPSYNLFVSLREQRSGSEAGLGWGIARRLGSSLLWALGWWLLAAVATGLLVGTYVSLKTLRGTPRSAGSAPRPAQA